MMRDNRQEHARRTIRLRAALFPIPDGRGCKSEARRELGLAQAGLLANSPDVDRSRAIDLHVGNTDACNVLASGVGEGLVEACQKAAGSGLLFGARLLAWGLDCLGMAAISSCCVRP